MSSETTSTPHKSIKGTGTANSSGNGNGSGNNRNNNNNNNKNNRSNNNQQRRNRSNKGKNNKRQQQQKEQNGISDEEALIRFTPYLRSNEKEAVRIHETYNNNNELLLNAIKQYLLQQKQQEQKQDEKKTIIVKDKQQQQKGNNNNNNNNKNTLNDMSSMVNAVSDLIDSDKDDNNNHSQHQQKQQPQSIKIKQQHNKNQFQSNNTANDTTTKSHNQQHNSKSSKQPQQPKQHQQWKNNNHSTATVDHVFPPTPSTKIDIMNNKTIISKDINNNTTVVDTSATASTTTTDVKTPVTTTTITHKPYQKRLIRNQPGKIIANNISTNKILILPPRAELTARWSLPLDYLRQLVLKKTAEQTNEKTPNITVRDALSTLSVGLYRRGCSDNGSMSSIISKEVMGCNVQNNQPFSFAVDEKNDIVWGEVPFYSPRSPGTIVFRLYFENDSIVTLATGPTIIVDVQVDDLESTLRFILSNFKSKKGSGLSSMYSLSITFDNFRIPSYYQSSPHHQQQRSINIFEGAGRAAWGCICESRKIVQASEEEYLKRKDKIIIWESELGLEKDILDSAATTTAEEDNEVNEDQEKNNEEYEEHLLKWRERMSAVMSEKAMIDRKWREVQVAYSIILRAVLANHPCYIFIRRDLITKLRLEYELYCTLTESFAPNPFQQKQQQNNNMTSITIFPHPIHSQHFNSCAKSRMEMQLHRLGFIPRFDPIITLLKNNKGSTAFQKITASMHTLYERDLSPNADFYRYREEIRSCLQDIVQLSEFPTGTDVAIFGSSANGFGSSYSDLDLCLQLPSTTKTTTTTTSVDTNATTSSTKEKDDESINFHDLLNQLSIDLEHAGMKSINTSRLSARIPIIMFHYPQRLNNTTTTTQEYDPDDPTTYVKCEISMQNSLALLNTSLLMTYSSIDPRVRVLASIIKLWAKNRDINNPSSHTLSTYGYILMMLHFLIQFKGSSNNSTTTNEKGFRQHQNKNYEDVSILPNLQWIDPFLQASNKNKKNMQRNPFSTLSHKPKQAQFLMTHPRVPDYAVNTYFCRPPDEKSLRILTENFSGNNRTSVGILLASFFRYYAYEFDYKKYVVSLNYSTTTTTTNINYPTSTTRAVQKETKGETEGWKLYGSGGCGILSIEDPFETFYDVAHVLKLSSFHRIRREFAMAYTKIVNIVFNNTTANALGIDGDDLMINSCESGEDIIQWICQEIDRS